MDRETFDTVQAVFAGNSQPKYSKQEIAFRGLMNCGYDGCMLTGEIKKRSTSTTAAPVIAESATYPAFVKMSWPSASDNR